MNTMKNDTNKRWVIHTQLRKESSSCMIYRHKNKHKLDGVYSNYQGHEKPQKRKEKKGLSLTFKQRT